MSKVDNPLDIYKQLPKTNCGDCGIATCMAFANAVITAGKPLRNCPHITEEVVRMFEGNIGERLSIEREQENETVRLKGELANSDLTELASRMGLEIVAGRLVIKSLGRDFFIDPEGNLSSECHASMPWLSIPMLGYLLKGGSAEPAGSWVEFGELKGCSRWSRLFGRRCEFDLKELADAHPDLFSDLTALFSGGMDESFMDADVSLILYPLPRIPMLICYWREEDGFESKLRVYFDRSVEKNLDPSALYTLSVGLVIMFGKIAERHG